MTQNIRVFFSAFIVAAIASLLLNTGASKLADFFFWNELASNPAFGAAQAASQKLHEEAFKSLPMLKKGVQDLELQSRAALSLFVTEEGNVRVLYGSNKDASLPIASLTKLMTALVAAEHYAMEDVLLVSKKAVEKEENLGNLKVGEKLSLENLLHVMLMESSNDAAVAVAEHMGEAAFLAAMNAKARELNMAATSFVDVAGVDPEEEQGASNLSSVQDLAVLASSLRESYPKVFAILALKQYDMHTPEGVLHHTLVNTNELLSYEKWPTPIMGGKTGWTPKAKGCLVLVLESPKRTGYLVNVVLGSDERFEDMKNLANWVFRSYTWSI